MSGVTLINRGTVIDAARRLSTRRRNVSVPAILAVAEVEAGAAGPWVQHKDERRPVVLFEAHLFYRHSGTQPVSKTHPWLSSRVWDRRLYNETGPGSVKEGENRQWVRLEQAMELDRAGAICSASFGLFQVLGQNWKALGYDSAEHFYDLMHLSVDQHFEAFVRFVEVNGLSEELALLDFDRFAERCNGPAYRRNQYAARMRAAHRRWVYEGGTMRAKRYQPVRMVIAPRSISEPPPERSHPVAGWYPDETRSQLGRDRSVRYVGPSFRQA